MRLRVDDALPARELEVDGERGRADAGVGVHDVEAAVPPPGLLDDRVDVTLVRGVAAAERRLVAVRRELGGELLAGRLVDVEHRDASAGDRERARRGGPDAAGARDDHRHPALERAAHASPGSAGTTTSTSRPSSAER